MTHTTPRAPQRWKATAQLPVFDGLILLALTAATAWLRHSCVPWSDVSGDAYMALECAWKMWNGDLAATPSQPIYGYGLCASMAGLYLGAEELWQVAVRRALTGTFVVPAFYLLTLCSVPRLFGTGPATTRFAGVAVGLFALSNDLLGVMATSGTLGYFAPPMIGLIFICWSIALGRSAPLLSVLGLALVPMAMMNHPFSLWLVPTALIFAPALAQRSGRRALAGGFALAVLISMPRLLQLLELVRREENWLYGLKLIADPGGRLDEPYAQKLWQDLQNPENMMIPLALLLAALTPLLLKSPRGAPHERRLWAMAALASAGVVVLVGVSIHYLRSYHVMLLYPFAAIAAAGWLALAAERFAPHLKRRIPINRINHSFQRWKVATITVTSCWLLVGAGVFSLMDKSELRPDEDHCTGGFKNTSTAASARIVTNRIEEDLPGHAIVLENLRPSDGGVDSAVSIALDLLLRGLREGQLRCCEPGSTPTWYWIVDWRGIPTDFRKLAAELDEVELLLELEVAEELVLAVRSEAARLAVGEALCGGLGPEEFVSGRTYRTYLGNLLVPGCDEPPPPEPYPACMSDRVIF